MGSRWKCPACGKRHQAKRQFITDIDRAFIARFEDVCLVNRIDAPMQMDPSAVRFVRIHNRFPNAGEIVRTPLGFDTRIVGVSHYQHAIAKCRVGEAVTLIREPKNRQDKRAVAVISAQGETIGFLNSERYVAQAIIDEVHAVEATIHSMGKAPERVNMGVELDIVLLGPGTGPIGERDARAYAKSDA